MKMLWHQSRGLGVRATANFSKDIQVTWGLRSIRPSPKIAPKKHGRDRDSVPLVAHPKLNHTDTAK